MFTLLILPATCSIAYILACCHCVEISTKSLVANRLRSVTISDVASVLMSLTISLVASVFKSETISLVASVFRSLTMSDVASKLMSLMTSVTASVFRSDTKSDVISDALPATDVMSVEIAASVFISLTADVVPKIARSATASAVPSLPISVALASYCANISCIASHMLLHQSEYQLPLLHPNRCLLLLYVLALLQQQYLHVAFCSQRLLLNLCYSIPATAVEIAANLKQ